MNFTFLPGVELWYNPNIQYSFRQILSYRKCVDFGSHSLIFLDFLTDILRCVFHLKVKGSCNLENS